MVSSLLADALSDPSSVLQDLYQKNREANNFPRVVVHHFASVFASDADIQQVRIQNLFICTCSGNKRPLVRFRAMVQSTGTEVYCKELPARQLGGWGLAEECGDRVDDDPTSHAYEHFLDDRTTLWAVSVPGESAWASGTAVKTLSQTSAQSKKNPFPSQAHLGVNVKLYGSEAESLKLTDVVTFVGILVNAPILNVNEEEIEVPTLHTVFHRSPDESRLPFKFPMDMLVLGAPNDIIQNLTLGPLHALRSELIAWIAAEGLGGDTTVAEWILMACISRVQSREPPILPLSLTISSFPAPPPIPNTSPTRVILEPTIKHVLQLLLPALVHLPLSISFMNESRFQPQSVDEELLSGCLQLPAGTVVLVSDSAVSEGTLHETGVRNVAALKQCVRNQTLDYIFPYSSFPFQTDLEFIALAQGRTSPFVETDVYVPLRPGEGVSVLYKDAAQVQKPPAEKLKHFRDLLGGAKQGKVQISEEISQFIQQDYVRGRQSSPSPVTSDDLILRMSLARLMSLSFHSPELTKDIWAITKKLDDSRKELLRATAPGVDQRGPI
ncbi:uncharacterized protein EI90DRAFT_2947780 [Cantharellus anzutake]|uniref:uncharacterized protein n=1 Tax=Cantharellus anzutake TaxID=1750568 RepID=UPI0019075962|nr:uncharacterized protein EI90DRAFT_2947780 [Cantharellus anzutake]KAF8314823.1 hypothetical protein EI90DRAFT_2947780 [Cantharellus anzutake]